MADLGGRLDEGTAIILEVVDALRKQISDVESKMEEWKQLEKRMEGEKLKAKNKVVLDVGGKRFATTRGTLLKFDNTYFAGLLTTIQPDSDGSYFIDRNPKYFGILLDYLRSGELECEDLSASAKKKLSKDFAFFGIPFPVEYTFSNKKLTATMAGAYQVNKGTLLYTGIHTWSVRVDMLVSSYDLGVVSPSHSSHFNTGTNTAWGLREFGQCFPGKQLFEIAFTRGDTLTFHLNLEEKTMNIDINNVRHPFTWTCIIAPVHLAFSGGKGASATILRNNEK